MRFLLGAFFAIGFFLIITMFPAMILAQQVDTNPPANDTVGQGTDTGFDWRWLIPLLAVPVLFYAFKDRSEEDYYRDRYLQGVKGGQTHRESEFGDEDDEE